MTDACEAAERARLQAEITDAKRRIVAARQREEAATIKVAELQAEGAVMRSVISCMNFFDEVFGGQPDDHLFSCHGPAWESLVTADITDDPAGLLDIFTVTVPSHDHSADVAADHPLMTPEARWFIAVIDQLPAHLSARGRALAGRHGLHLE